MASAGTFEIQPLQFLVGLSRANAPSRKHFEPSVRLPRGPSQDANLIELRSFQIAGQAIKAAERPEILLQRRAFAAYAHRPPRQRGGGPVAAAPQLQRRSENLRSRSQQQFLVRGLLGLDSMLDRRSSVGSATKTFCFYVSGMRTWLNEAEFRRSDAIELV